MSRKSNVEKLPETLRNELHRLLRLRDSGELTLDDITGHMKQLGAGVSRSGIDRYAAQMKHVADDIRLTREMAKALGRELKDDIGSDATPMLVETGHALLLKARTQLIDSGDIDTKSVADFAKALKDFTTASKTNIDMVNKLREQLARDAVQAVDEVVSQATEGITGATVEAIKAKILGIGKAA